MAQKESRIKSFFQKFLNFFNLKKQKQSNEKNSYSSKNISYGIKEYSPKTKDSQTNRVKTFFQKFWNTVKPQEKNLKGSQRPYKLYNIGDRNIWGRDYDFEIKEVVLRDPDVGRPLVEMLERCPEVAVPIHRISNSMKSSIDGDDQGFAIAETLNDNKTKVNKKVKYILDRLIEEKIGGARLEWALQRFIAYGDAFASIQIDMNQRRISNLLPLPTWQMFRVESDQGILMRYEQRYQLRDVTNEGGDGVAFIPSEVVHWRFRRSSLYGKSLFYQSIQDWEGLKTALNTLNSALLEVGINPNVHQMPCDLPEGFIEAYQEGLKAQRILNQKPVSDYFMPHGGDIKKVSTKDPDLKAVLQVLNFHQQRLIMASCLPPWMLAWDIGGGREISQSPALAYARFINGCRQTFTEGIKQLCNTELALNGIPKEKWKYRIIWPKIYVDPFERQMNPLADESDRKSIDDLD